MVIKLFSITIITTKTSDSYCFGDAVYNAVYVEVLVSKWKFLHTHGIFCISVGKMPTKSAM